MKRKLSLLSPEELQDLLRRQDEEIRQKEKDLLKQEKQIRRHKDKIVKLHKEVKFLNKMMFDLNSKIAALTKKIFGKSSEKISQTAVRSEKGKEDSYIKIFPEKRSKKDDKKEGGKQRNRNFPKDLPRDEIHYELADSELDCECGGKLKKFVTEENELVDIIPEK